MPLDIFVERCGLYPFLVPDLQRRAFRQVVFMQRVSYQSKRLLGVCVHQLPSAREDQDG